MDLHRDGYTILPRIVSIDACEHVATEIFDALVNHRSGAIQSTGGKIVGSRNLIDCWEDWRSCLDRPSVVRLIGDTLSSNAGVVRILYFDKPPGQSWSLSLHRDKTIAVAEHQSSGLPFSKPTLKSGVPHVVATRALLQSMLTLRLHLDPMTDENGPFVVVPGSHNELEHFSSRKADVIHCDAGDMFVMRPLLLHGSRASDQETRMHRRVVHFEIAPNVELPGGYRWHRFEPF